MNSNHGYSKNQEKIAKAIVRLLPYFPWKRFRLEGDFISGETMLAAFQTFMDYSEQERNTIEFVRIKNHIIYLENDKIQSFNIKGVLPSTIPRAFCSQFFKSGVEILAAILEEKLCWKFPQNQETDVKDQFWLTIDVNDDFEYVVVLNYDQNGAPATHNCSGWRDKTTSRVIKWNEMVQKDWNERTYMWNGSDTIADTYTAIAKYLADLKRAADTPQRGV